MDVRVSVQMEIFKLGIEQPSTVSSGILIIRTSNIIKKCEPTWQTIQLSLRVDMQSITFWNNREL